VKGIILAGGSGTRLYPLTRSLSKQLLPVYDKPMIYYPLAVLLLMGVKDILIISTSRDIPLIEHLLKDGSQWGVSFTYVVQPEPKGIAQAFTLGEDFIGSEPVSLVLGDNIFFGHGLPELLKSSVVDVVGATVFCQYVRDPERYGVVDFDADDKPVAIFEKPVNPPSNYAVTGLYIYDNSVIERAKSLKPSNRGEYEITDLNNLYLKDDCLRVEKLGRGYAWLDTGTHASLLEASEFISVIQKRQGLQVACIDEIVYRLGYISAGQLEELAKPMYNSDYGKYLFEILKFE
jgi:glucose-1-phosphate thymidylyltransferase